MKHHTSIVTVRSLPFNVSEIIRYRQIPKILQIFRKRSSFSIQNLSHEPALSDCFIQFFFMRYFGYLNKDSKINCVSASLTSEIHDLSIEQELTLSGVPF